MNNNYWLQMRRTKEINKVIAALCAHYNITPNYFISLGGDAQDELVAKFKKWQASSKRKAKVT